MWVINEPVIDQDPALYVEYLDSVISATLPSQDDDPELYKLVKTYQIHSHSKTCRKVKNKNCRFNFGKFFSNCTIIAKPIENLSEYERFCLLQKRESILSKVKLYINNNLDPNKIKGTFDTNLTIEKILADLGISSEDCYWALSISSDSHYQIHFKRGPDSCFVNNYNPILLKAWQANIDLQPVCDYYKAITYMTAYFSKSETETTEALKHAVHEIRTQNAATKKAMHELAQAFISSRQLSVQEAVYFCLPELWLRKCFPGVRFVNTSLPRDRIRILKSEEEISQLSDDSTDIFQSNIINKYCNRPQTGAFSALSNLCFAQFAAYYTPQTTDENDYQSNQLNERDPIDNVSALPQKFPFRACTKANL